MSSKRTVLLYTIVLLLFCQIGLASDFNAFASLDNLNICSCSTEPVNTITVTNTGLFAEDYIATLEGTASWARIAPNIFRLEPGESITLSEYITSPCQTKGKYNLNVKIKPITGSEKVLQQTLSIDKCLNIKTTTNTLFLVSDPCDTTVFEFNITNTGTHTENYYFQANQDWLTPSTTKATIKPGKSQSILVFAKPSCDIYGEFPLKLRIDTEVSGYYTEMPFTLNILRNYQYTVNAGEYQIINSSTQFRDSNIYSICEGSQYRLPVKIENLMDFDNNYAINLNAPKWVSIDTKLVPVLASSDGYAEIMLEPELGLTGNYKFYVETLSEKGRISSIDELNVIVRQCYGTGLSIAVENDNVCVDEQKAYAVDIFNSGEFEETVRLGFNGDCVTLTQDLVTIPPVNKTTVNLMTIPNCDTGKHKITLFSESSTQVSEDTIELNILPLDECYKTEIERLRLNIKAPTTVSIPIANSGAKAATYAFTLEGPAWASLTTLQTIVEPGQTANVDIAFAPAAEVSGRFDVVLRAVADNKVAFSRPIFVVVGEESILDSMIYYQSYFLIGFAILLVLMVLILLLIYQSRVVSYTKDWGFVAKDTSAGAAINVDMAFTDIRFMPKQDLENAKVRITKLFSNPSNVKFAENERVYQFIELKNQNITDLKYAKIKFKVNKAWLEKNNIKTLALKRFDQAWHKLKTRKIDEDDVYVHYESFLTDLSYFAIVGVAPKGKKPALDEKKVDTKKIEEKKRAEKAVKEDKKPDKELRKEPAAKQDKPPSKTLFKNILVILLLLLGLAGIIFGNIYLIGYLIYAGVALLLIILIVDIFFLIKRKCKKAKVKEDKKVEDKRKAEKTTEDKKQPKKDIPIFIKLLLTVLLLLGLAGIAFGVIYANFLLFVGIGLLLLFFILGFFFMLGHRKQTDKQVSDNVKAEKAEPKKWDIKIKKSKLPWILGIIFITCSIISAVLFVILYRLVKSNLSTIMDIGTKAFDILQKIAGYGTTIYLVSGIILLLIFLFLFVMGIIRLVETIKTRRKNKAKLKQEKEQKQKEKDAAKEVKREIKAAVKKEAKKKPKKSIFKPIIVIILTILALTGIVLGNIYLISYLICAGIALLALILIIDIIILKIRFFRRWKKKKQLKKENGNEEKEKKQQEKEKRQKEKELKKIEKQRKAEEKKRAEKEAKSDKPKRNYAKIIRTTFAIIFLLAILISGIIGIFLNYIKLVFIGVGILFALLVLVWFYLWLKTRKKKQPTTKEEKKPALDAKEEDTKKVEENKKAELKRKEEEKNAEEKRKEEERKAKEKAEKKPEDKDKPKDKKPKKPGKFRKFLKYFIPIIIILAILGFALYYVPSMIENIKDQPTPDRTLDERRAFLETTLDNIIDTPTVTKEKNLGLFFIEKYPNYLVVAFIAIVILLFILGRIRKGKKPKKTNNNNNKKKTVDPLIKSISEFLNEEYKKGKKKK